MFMGCCAPIAAIAISLCLAHRPSCAAPECLRLQGSLRPGPAWRYGRCAALRFCSCSLRLSSRCPARTMAGELGAAPLGFTARALRRCMCCCLLEIKWSPCWMRRHAELPRDVAPAAFPPPRTQQTLGPFRCPCQLPAGPPSRISRPWCTRHARQHPTALTKAACMPRRGQVRCLLCWDVPPASSFSRFPARCTTVRSVVPGWVGANLLLTRKRELCGAGKLPAGTIPMQHPSRETFEKVEVSGGVEAAVCMCCLAWQPGSLNATAQIAPVRSLRACWLELPANSPFAARHPPLLCPPRRRPTPACLRATRLWRGSLWRRRGCCRRAPKHCRMLGCMTWMSCSGCGAAPRASTLRPSSSPYSLEASPPWHRT